MRGRDKEEKNSEIPGGDCSRGVVRSERWLGWKGLQTDALVYFGPQHFNIISVGLCLNTESVWDKERQINLSVYLHEVSCTGCYAIQSIQLEGFSQNGFDISIHNFRQGTRKCLNGIHIAMTLQQQVAINLFPRYIIKQSSNKA